MQHLYKISTVAIALVLIAVVLNYALTTEATIPHDVTTAIESSSDQPFPRNSTNLKKNGDYTVYITAVNQTPQETTFEMKDVVYFEGSEARVVAANEVPCSESIENCVATLRQGYYVRETNNHFTARMVGGSLRGAEIAERITEDPRTVFTVTVYKSMVTNVVEKK